MDKIVRQVDEYEKESDAQCKRCKGNCSFEGMGGTWQCYGFIPKTNFDNIKAMNIEELAEWFVHIQNDVCDYFASMAGKEPNLPTQLHTWEEWLRQEAPSD